MKVNLKGYGRKPFIQSSKIYKRILHNTYGYICIVKIPKEK